MNPIQLTDEQLVAKIRQENGQLYTEIVRRYKQKLLSYIRYLANNPNEAEDILQDVFIKVYKNLYDFNIHKKFSSWIYRIAHNETVNYIRKQAREKSFFTEFHDKIIDHQDSIANIDRKLLKKQLIEYVQELKIKYSEPIILYYFEDKSYEEISDILRIPVNTVGTLIHRGKNLVRELMRQKSV